MDEKQPLLKNNENQSQVDVENAGRHLKKDTVGQFLLCKHTDIDLMHKCDLPSHNFWHNLKLILNIMSWKIFFSLSDENNFVCEYSMNVLVFILSNDDSDLCLHKQQKLFFYYKTYQWIKLFFCNLRWSFTTTATNDNIINWTWWASTTIFVLKWGSWLANGDMSRLLSYDWHLVETRAACCQV